MLLPFICENLYPSVAKKPLSGFTKFCHVRPTWTHGSRSIPEFCLPTFLVLSRLAFGPGGEIKICRISRSAHDRFPGGRCWHPSLRRRRVPPLFWGLQLKP